MAYIILVQLLVLVFSIGLFAKVDRFHSLTYLGEKRLDGYAERFDPIINQDVYQGKIAFEDERFFQNFFSPYLFNKEEEYHKFIRSELGTGLSCSNQFFEAHYDDIRYAYRLITLSYLLEGTWHMNLLANHFGLQKRCRFDLKQWAATCKPKSNEMKKMIERLQKFAPRYEEILPPNYKKSDWVNDFTKNNFKWYSHYRMQTAKLPLERMPEVCLEDQKLMTLICSEEDDVYGLSNNRDAYYLLSLSNIVNSFNKSGEAVGCLRRFSEVMAHKEVRYNVLNHLFPVIQSFLRQTHQERFLQGRVFFFGSSKEFEEKGLTDFYVKEQPIVVAKLAEESKEPIVTSKKTEVSKVSTVTPTVEKSMPAPKIEKKEIRKPVKSAFLLAAEVRASENLDRAEVDMLKLKYDYVFSLNMINNISDRLKVFMSREALIEMMNFDKLGTKTAPVPLLFIKFMVDMEEHHGLWNLLSILGDKFYVSNEIDGEFKPAPEFVQIKNDETTGRTWQIYVLRP